MSDSQFPLSRAAGLGIWYDAEWTHDGKGFVAHMIEADQVEKMLAEAPVVYGHGKSWIEGGPNHDPVISTHSAKLVCIEPIKRDTAESLLRELVESDEQEGRYGNRHQEALLRAKRLLGNK